ncbi:hypothetical protein O1L60_01575 [Streptomyces diastatochromogenes]|nr:hypothetical protein [Streptomyces diastatochromogenes]
MALHPELHRFLGAGSPAAADTRTAVALHLARLLDTYADRFLGGERGPPASTSTWRSAWWAWWTGW